MKRRIPNLAAELDTGALDRGAQRLGLVGTMGSQVIPTVVGLIAFGSMPQLVRPEWGVACIRVRGANLADEVASREDVEGPLTALAGAPSSSGAATPASGAERFASGLHGCYRESRTGVTIRQASMARRLKC